MGIASGGTDTDKLPCHERRFPGGGAGSASDPLVTLSYLNDVFLGQIMTKVDQKIAARNSQLLQQSGGAGGMSGVEFAVVTLSKGQVLTGDIGCEVMLRVGTASCVSPLQSGSHRRDYRCLPE